MAKRTYRIEFTMTFEGQIESDNDEEAKAIMADITTGTIWEDGDNWTLEGTGRRIIDSWDNDDNTDNIEEDNELAGDGMMVKCYRCRHEVAEVCGFCDCCSSCCTCEEEDD